MAEASEEHVGAVKYVNKNPFCKFLNFIFALVPFGGLLFISLLIFLTFLLFTGKTRQ